MPITTFVSLNIKTPGAEQLIAKICQAEISKKPFWAAGYPEEDEGHFAG